MKISYANGGNLFVPVNQMNLIQKYIGSYGVTPKLNKLGGQEWKKAKTKSSFCCQNISTRLSSTFMPKEQIQKVFILQRYFMAKEFEEDFLLKKQKTNYML